MSQLIVHAGDFTFQARFEEQLAPKTVAAFRKAMPFESQAIHVRWSGEGVWMPLGDLDFGVTYENHTSYPAPGQIILYPGGISETEILLAYGGVHFARRWAARRQPFHHPDLGAGEPGRVRQDRAVEGCAKNPFRGSLDERAFLPSRPPRLRPQPARSEMAGRGARRRAVRGQLRRGRREQHPARRPASEAFLSEILGAQPWPGQRHRI